MTDGVVCHNLKRNKGSLYVKNFSLRLSESIKTQLRSQAVYNRRDKISLSEWETEGEAEAEQVPHVPQPPE